MVIDGKSLQEYPVSAGLSESSILGPTPPTRCINNLPDVICNTTIYVGDLTLFSNCDWAFGFWQQLELLLNLNPIYETLFTGTESRLLI